MFAVYKAAMKNEMKATGEWSESLFRFRSNSIEVNSVEKVWKHTNPQLFYKKLGLSSSRAFFNIPSIGTC